MGQRRALISYFYFDHLILLQFMITYFSISKQKAVDALFCSLQSLALIIGCQNFVSEMMRSDLGQMPYLESTVVFL